MECDNCRFWSEMLARSEGGGATEAFCLSKDSPHCRKYTVSNNGCEAGKENLYGAIDAPGNDGIYDD